MSLDDKADIKASALELIGNTPLVALDRIWKGPGRILAKCEFMNPGGSIKDRPAYGIIQKALESGDLKPGGSVVTMTSGNFGIGLALVCGVLGHPITVTMSKGNSPQRAVMMRAMGATVELVDQVNGAPGNVTRADMLAAEEIGRKIAKETGALYLDQFTHPANVVAHENSTGPEIWKQTGGKLDAFITAVGTSGTFTGVSTYLKRMRPEVKCYAMEPEGCEPLKGCEITKRRHILQGSGLGHIPDHFNFDNFDGSFSVSDDEATEYKKLLAVQEGIYVGFTSGGNVAAAVKLLKSGELDEDAVVVTVLPDTGLKYPV